MNWELRIRNSSSGISAFFLKMGWRKSNELMVKPGDYLIFQTLVVKRKNPAMNASMLYFTIMKLPIE